MVIFACLPDIFFSQMFFRLIVSLLTQLIPVVLFCQDISTRNSDRQGFISFQLPDVPPYSNGNAILLQFAAALDENPRQIKIGVTYTEAIKVQTSPMKSPDVTILFTPVTVFVAPVYRKFSMKDVVTPDLVTCNLNLIELPDSNILRQFRMTDLSVSQLAEGYKSADIPVLIPGEFSVTLSDVSFHYSDQAIMQFRDKIETINNYYASSSLIDSLLVATSEYNPLTTGDLPEKYILLSEINRIISLIGNYRFQEKLSLKQNDPEQFALKFLTLDKFSRSASMTFEQQIKEAVSISWSVNLESLADEYISHLISYIRRSMIMNGIRGGIYNDYLESWFQIPGFPDDRSTFNELLMKMYPGDDPAVHMALVTRALGTAYVKGTRLLLDEFNFVGALLLLEHADAFSEKVRLQVHPGFKPLQVEAVKGIYSSYLGIAESCIDLQKFQMAEEYINQAGEYLAGYQEIIPTDTMFQRVFRKLFNHRLQACDYILGENQFMQALDCYQLFSLSYPPEMIAYVKDHLDARQQQALRGLFFQERDQVLYLMKKQETDSALIHYDNACRYQELIPDDIEAGKAQKDLNSKMLNVRYRQLADRGTYLYMTYNHEEAYRTFTQMKEIGARIGLPVDSALNRMYLESYKHHMLNEISMATNLIWKDEFEMAKEYASEVESVMDLYNLESDPDLLTALNGYRQKIDLKICLHVKDEVETLAIRAMQNIQLKKFDLAVRQLGDARQKVRQHSGCELDHAAYDDTIKKYLSAAFYLEKQQQAINKLTIGNFTESLRLVYENERFYRNTQLEKFGVPYTSTIDFAGQSGRLPMYIEAASFFLEIEDVNSAWICLTWIKKDRVESKDARDLQERIGAALSLLDQELFPGSDPETRIRSYTGGNRWFAKFAQAYSGMWKQLETKQESKKQ